MERMKDGKQEIMTAGKREIMKAGKPEIMNVRKKCKPRNVNTKLTPDITISQMKSKVLQIKWKDLFLRVKGKQRELDLDK